MYSTTRDLDLGSTWTVQSTPTVTVRVALIDNLIRQATIAFYPSSSHVCLLSCRKRPILSRMPRWIRRRPSSSTLHPLLPSPFVSLPLSTSSAVATNLAIYVLSLRLRGISCSLSQILPARNVLQLFFLFFLQCRAHSPNLKTMTLVYPLNVS